MLLAGQIGKPHGLAGEVYVVVISDDPRRFESGSTLHHSDGRTLVVERARAHADRFLVKFEGVDDRPAAESLRGALYVPDEDVRRLDEDEYWYDDLVGCMVVRSTGDEIGTVRSVLERPAQDLLEVDTPRGPRLIPIVKEIVVDVDTKTRRIVIDPPEGLLD